jgi:hypothetical protein
VRAYPVCLTGPDGRAEDFPIYCYERSPSGGTFFNRKEKDMAKAKKPKKAAAKKKAVKTSPKKTVSKKTAKKASGVKKGSRYVCGVCGLAVTVDTACGCEEETHLICCEKPMRKKK